MATGIDVNDNCVSAYHALSKRSHSIVVFKMNPEMTQVVVDKTYPSSRGNFEAEWKDFVKHLPADECRYIVADFQWKDTPTVTKSKVIAILYTSDSAPIRQKMVYASSQETVNTKMPVQRSIQATDLDDLDYKSVKDSVAK